MVGYCSHNFSCYYSHLHHVLLL
uniref:Uncharacterized protein n=1 Tax=Arundo donax TaxID=35708 RepID=A0A0A9GV58_ARUDO